MDKFKREERYIVIKVKDAIEFLSIEQKLMLADTNTTINAERLKHGKEELECLVVESDWPEYEPTWNAIQKRVERET